MMMAAVGILSRDVVHKDVTAVFFRVQSER